MALWDYECANCGCRFEFLEGVGVRSPATCKECGSKKVRRVKEAPLIARTEIIWRRANGLLEDKTPKANISQKRKKIGVY